MNDSRNKPAGWQDTLGRNDFLLVKIVGAVLFVAVAAWLSVVNADYFWKAQELSLFVPSSAYFLDKMQVAGGFLSYCGCLLVQFFYYPWLGCALLILLSLALASLVGKAFNIPGRWSLLALIPATMMFLSTVDLGYLIYSIKAQGYIYSNILGLMFASAMFLCYRKIGNKWLKYALLVVIVAGFYPVAGSYALLAAILSALYEMTNKGKKDWIAAVIAVALVAIVPQIYFWSVYERMTVFYIYLAGLPRFYMGARVLYEPFIVTFVTLAILAILAGRWNKGTSPTKVKFAISAIIGVASVVCMGYCAFDDENFRVTIKMDRAMNNDDWNEVVNSIATLKGEPTRLMVLNTDLALYKLGRAGDEMFKYKISDTPYKVPMPMSVMRIVGAKAIYYHFGKINYCYRWCMEDKVEYGMKVEYLKYMVKCALLNGEYKLAQKYNNVLHKTWFHSDWADKYQRFIDNPELIKEDAEFKSIIPLMAYEDALEGDGGLLEGYVIGDMVRLAGGPEPLVELSLQCALIQKDIEAFWPRFMLYARTHERLPIHYQEAAILYSFLEHKVDYRQFKIDKAVEERFNQFINMSQQYAGIPEQNLKGLFSKQYGGTFWYYYFFITNLKTS